MYIFETIITVKYNAQLNYHSAVYRSLPDASIIKWTKFLSIRLNENFQDWYNEFDMKNPLDLLQDLVSCYLFFYIAVAVKI